MQETFLDGYKYAIQVLEESLLKTQESMEDKDEKQQQREDDIKALMDLDLGVQQALIFKLEYICENERCSLSQKDFLDNVEAFIKKVGNKGHWCQLENVMDVAAFRVVSRVLLEFLFLQKENFDDLQLYSEYFDDISISRKFVERTQDAIEDEYVTFGVDAMINKYATEKTM